MTRRLTAPVDTSGGWPGIAGFSHDDACYCVDCAEQNDAIDTEQARRDDAQLPKTGVILADEEWDRQPRCAACEKPLNVQVLEGARR